MRILAIGAHPDDIEINVAGTLLKYKKQLGATIARVVCTDGELGGDPTERMREQKIADKALGVDFVYNLGLKDEYLTHNGGLVSALDKVIAEFQPEWVFAHSDQDYHQDHIAVAKAIKSANRLSKFSLFTYPGQDIKLPFLCDTYVDISNYFDQKMEILQIFESQSHRVYLQEENVRIKNAGLGVAEYVERFNVEFLKL